MDNVEMLFCVVYGDSWSDCMHFSDLYMAKKKLVIQSFAFQQKDDGSHCQRPFLLEYVDDHGVWMRTKNTYYVDMDKLSQVPEHQPEAAFDCIVCS